jgi:Ca-activated chloride channel family protein
MNFPPDDPKLTAYALGELSRVEAEEIERELQDSPELRQTLEEIRQMTEMLKKELAAEPALALDQTQKQIIEAALPPKSIVPFPRRKYFATAGIAAMAASLMFVVAWQLWLAPEAKKISSQRPSSASQFKYAQNASSDQGKKLPEEHEVPTVSSPIPMTPPPERTSPLSRVEPAPQTTVTIPSSAANPEPRFAKTTQETEATGYEVARSHSKTADKNFNFSPDQYAVATGSRKSVSPALEPAEGVRTTPTRAVRSQLLAQQTRGDGLRTDFESEVASRGRTTESARRKEPARDSLAAVQRDWNSSADGKIYKNDDVAEELQHLQKQIDSLGRTYQPNHPKMRALEVQVERLKQTGDTARYPRYAENAFESVSQNPLSTFSIDVDTASYANVRRFLNEGQLPPRDAVRVEEMVNYFIYDYPPPRGDEPFSVNMEVASCPWSKQHRLLRIGLKGKEIAQDKRPPSNFVFLIDVSGSMSPNERLPLIKQALRMLVKRMTENDRIAMVVYASSSGVVLESTSCVNKEEILEAIDKLEAGGSTNGGEGIQKAYALAEEHFIKGGVNRVILATDGDFNVGITDQGELINLIQKKAKNGIFLSALGVGTDNYKDALLQKLADKGNGNYHYLDTLEEAQKVLIQQMNGTLVTIAKDVKIQIEFNPAQVKSYRLIGYEKRILEAEDFNNDKKDAGEIGAGHTVTALYEIIPANVVEDDELRPVAEELKYQPKRAAKVEKKESGDRDFRASKELLTLKLRYKKPDGVTSKLNEFTVNDDGRKFSSASADFRFATAVAAFGMVLKNSECSGDFSFEQIAEVAGRAKGDDKEGYRAEFINLVKKAKSLK